MRLSAQGRFILALNVLFALVVLHQGIAAAGKLQDIKDRGALLVGVKDATPPFGFLDESTNRLVGFEVDIAREVAEQMHVSLALVPVTSVDRIPLLLQGAVDMVIATMTHTYEREEIIDFSITYFMDGQKIMASAKSGITDVLSLAGKRVGTVRGSTSEKTIKTLQPNCSVMSYENYPQAFMALKNGDVDALTSDSVILLGLKQVDENPGEWVISKKLLSREPYAIGVPENDSDFKDAVNSALVAIWKSGKYSEIYKKWFGPDSKYHIPLKWEMTLWP